MWFWHNKKLEKGFQKVTPEDLMKYRLSKRPGLLIKIGDSLYLIRISKKNDVDTSLFDTRLCDTCAEVCQGCPYIDAFSLSMQLRLGRTFSEAVKLYSRLERYPFITMAVEVFDHHDSLCAVSECQNYHERVPEDPIEDYFCETI